MTAKTGSHAIPKVWTLVRSGEYEKAIELCLSALAHDDANPKLWHALGVARLEQNELSLALEAFRTRLSIDPSSGPGHYFLAKTLHRMGDLSGALTAARQASSLQPSLHHAVDLAKGIEKRMQPNLAQTNGTTDLRSGRPEHLAEQRTFTDLISDADIHSGNLHRDTYRSLSSFLGPATLASSMILAGVIFITSHPLHSRWAMSDGQPITSIDEFVAGIFLLLGCSVLIWVLLASILTRYQIYDHWVEIQYGILVQRREVIFWYEVDNVSFSRTIFDRIGDTATLVVVLTRDKEGRLRWFPRFRTVKPGRTVFRIHGLGDRRLVTTLYEKIRNRSLHQSYDVKDRFI